jgi:hypothetical protein
VPFEKYVCWNKDLVKKFLDIEASEPPMPFFLATHHPVKMVRLATFRDALDYTPGGEADIYTESDLLRDFTEPDAPKAAIILGDVGTGKSHLVRWLAEQHPSTDCRRVVFIRREGTNLRSILETILNSTGMTGGVFDEFRERLRKSASGFRTPEEARERLLYNLALACGPQGPHGNQGLKPEEQELVNGIHDYLLDGYFRRQFLKDGGVLHQIITNTLGTSPNSERVAEPRQFRLEDLPSPRRQAGEPGPGPHAQQFYNKLTSVPVLKPEAVRWLNLHLNSSAIAELLELRGEELQGIMKALRYELRQRGQELVLLIEDFARMQGVDRQMLAALTLPAGNAMCPLRLALGCTTGYFRGLPETAQDRFKLFVHLDLHEGNGPMTMSAAETERFVARYLNAVRLEEASLKQWYNSGKDAEERGPVPNACAGCPHKGPCQAAFGEGDGTGLYPFTSTALGRMVPRISPGGFRPRKVIVQLLQHVLTEAGKEFRRGQFPSRGLHAHFKGAQLSAKVNAELKRVESDPALRDRRAALLDLWTDGSQVVNLDPVIHQVFSLPLLRDSGADLASIVREIVGQAMVRPVDARLAGATLENVQMLGATQCQVFVGILGDESRRQACQDALQQAGAALARRAAERAGLPALELNFVVFLRTVDPDPDLDDPTRERLKELDDWQNGNPPSSELLNFVRHHVFTAIRDHVNWDTLPLLRRHVMGEDSRLFRKRSIQMAGQEQEQRGGYRVDLNLPPEGEDRTETARALQGMILFEKRGHWDYPDGSELARCYAHNLERWSESVLYQVHRPRAEVQPWDPVPALVELLAFKGALAGQPIGGEDLTTAVDALFRKVDTNVGQGRAGKWRELFLALYEQQDTLAEQLKSHVPCTKGSDPRVQVVDVSRLLPALQAVRADWRPHAEVPADLWETYAVVREVRKRVDEWLAPAVEEERHRMTTWAVNTRAALPPEASRDAASEAVERAAARAREEGVFGPQSWLPLEDALTEFRSRDVDACLKALEALPAEKAPGLLPALGAVRGEEMVAVDGFLARVWEFLTLTQKRVDDEVKGLHGGAQLKKLIEEVGSALKDLDDVTVALGGDS